MHATCNYIIRFDNFPLLLVATGATTGGLPYGDLYEPKEFGSAGGGQYGTTLLGGRGGGKIWVNVTNTLDIDGLISSNGGAGTNYYYTSRYVNRYYVSLL